MTRLPAEFAHALALYRRGDAAGARAQGEAALLAQPGNADLLQFLGVVCCRDGDIDAGADYLHRALDLKPGDVATRVNLVTALVDLGRLGQAEAVCAADVIDDATPLWRIRGYVLQALGRGQEAASCYERVVESDPNDFETWNNLGNARRESGDLGGAVAALAEARRLRPDLAILHLNLAAALTEAGRAGESLDMLEGAARMAPDDPALLLELGRAFSRLGRHADALMPLERAVRLAPRDPQLHVEVGLTHGNLGARDRAEAAYRQAIEVQPDFAPAYVNLGTLLDHSNRSPELAALLHDADRLGIAADALAFVRALSLRRDGKLRDALALALAAPPTTDPNRKAQLIGELSDRLEDTGTAFASFEEMNRLVAESPTAPRLGAAEYRHRLDATAALTTPNWFAGWTPAEPDRERPSPVFLVGFPRSGTTLLDTVLMGHPDVVVLEEEPLVQHVAERLGGLERLAGLGRDELDDLRAGYFAELDRLAPAAAAKTVIDKMPLNIAHTALIHRIFPDARFVFALRHPCDVVLSCFMQNFGMNYAMANFLDLGDAARLYDGVLGYWYRCRAIFPLRVHDIRYEAMVEDLEGAVRPLLGYLDLAWDENILDHQRTARRRGYISSASYAQVTEPLHARASGRWLRYRAQMHEVLPLLAPWAERLGYGPLEA